MPASRPSITRPAALILALAAAAALAAPLHADDVTDQIEAARKAYEAGELRSAAQTLQFAAAAIQEKIDASLLELLPEPPEGWSAEAAQAQSGGMTALIAGRQIARRYHRDDGAEVEVSITADSPFLAMMTMMLSNPMLLQADPAARVLTHEGHRGVVKHEQGTRQWEISLMVGNQILVQATGTGLSERAELETFLDAMDLEAVQKAFSG